MGWVRRARTRSVCTARADRRRARAQRNDAIARHQPKRRCGNVARTSTRRRVDRHADGGLLGLERRCRRVPWFRRALPRRCPRTRPWWRPDPAAMLRPAHAAHPRVPARDLARPAAARRATAFELARVRGLWAMPRALSPDA